MLKNKLFTLFDKSQKRKLLLLLFFMLIASLSETIGLGLIFPIAGLFLNDTAAVNNWFIIKLTSFFDISSFQLLPYALSLFLIFYLLKIFFLIFYSWYENKFLYSFKENLSSNLFKKYISQNFNFFQGRNSSEFIRNIIDEVNLLTVYLVSVLKLSLETFILIGILSFLIYLNWFVAIIISLVFFLLITAYMRFFREKLDSWGKLRQLSSQKRLQFMQEGFEGVTNIKLLGREQFFFNNFKKHNLDLSKVSMKVGFLNSLPRLLFEILGIFTIITVFFILFQGKANFAEITQLLAVYVAASFRVLPSVNRILLSLQLIRYNYPAISTIYSEFQSFKPQQETSQIKKFDFKKNILVNIKNFKHSKDSAFQLNNIQFTIDKGQKIGIIGSSGAGKSTLIELLLGILKPNNGDIKIDGKSIFLYSKNWQKLVGYIPQKIFIFDNTFRNNILFGLENEKYNDDKLIELIEKVNLSKLLKRLPKGLDHRLGERGINLSGGEIQRIGIARAFIYDPEIIFFDEATSSLDTFTEKKILNEMENFKDKTFISVAHRIGTLKNCNIIYHLNNGKIIDSGDYNKFNQA